VESPKLWVLRVSGSHLFPFWIPNFILEVARECEREPLSLQPLFTFTKPAIHCRCNQCWFLSTIERRNHH
ncbi:hypothetical protein VIGAN_10121500, partial [Vigna angularis var. angularis]